MTTPVKQTTTLPWGGGACRCAPYGGINVCCCPGVVIPNLLHVSCTVVEFSNPGVLVPCNIPATFPITHNQAISDLLGAPIWTSATFISGGGCPAIVGLACFSTGGGLFDCAWSMFCAPFLTTDGLAHDNGIPVTSVSCSPLIFSFTSGLHFFFSPIFPEDNTIPPCYQPAYNGGFIPSSGELDNILVTQ